MSAEDQPIRYLGDLRRLQPEPGDVYVLSIDQRLSVESMARLRQWWAEKMGDAKVLVLDQGGRLGVVAEPKV